MKTKSTPRDFMNYTEARHESDCVKRKMKTNKNHFDSYGKLFLTVLNKMAELRASDWLCPYTLLLILRGEMTRDQCPRAAWE
jgi:hypothetical protein